MIGYNDMTYCRAACRNMGCSRNKRHLDDNPAFEAWAEKVGGHYVVYADFSAACPEYEPEDA